MNKTIVTTIGAAGVLALSSIASADVVTVNALNSVAESIYVLPNSTPVESRDEGSDNPWSGAASVSFNSDVYGSGQGQADADHSWTLTSTSLLYSASGSTNNVYTQGESNNIGLNSDTSTTVKFSLSQDSAYSIQTTMNQQGPGETYGFIQNIDTGNVSEWSYQNDGGTFGDMGTLVAGDYVLFMDSYSFYQPPISFGAADQTQSQYDLTFSVATLIPLPAAGFMGLAGIGGLAFTRRRRDDA
jgi:hypothetical protein